MSKDQPTQSDIGSEDADVKAIDDELDAEGHRRFVRATEDEGTDEPVGGQQPGDPDSARFSDRNLKVHVVPVTW